MRISYAAMLLAAALLPQSAPARIRTLIIDGQNNHDWRATTPVLKRLLEETNLFQVEVATAPPQDVSGFPVRRMQAQARTSRCS